MSEAERGWLNGRYVTYRKLEVQVPRAQALISLGKIKGSPLCWPGQLILKDGRYIEYQLRMGMYTLETSSGIIITMICFHAKQCTEQTATIFCIQKLKRKTKRRRVGRKKHRFYSQMNHLWKISVPLITKRLLFSSSESRSTSYPHIEHQNDPFTIILSVVF